MFIAQDQTQESLCLCLTLELVITHGIHTPKTELLHHWKNYTEGYMEMAMRLYDIEEKRAVEVYDSPLLDTMVENRRTGLQEALKDAGLWDEELEKLWQEEEKR